MSVYEFKMNGWSPNWYKSADEKEQTAFREWFRDVLRNERVTLTFVKADGTDRVMQCSLHPDLIPAEKLEKEKASPRKRSEAAQVVWDIEKQDWRSFRFDSVKEFTFTLGELHA